MGRQSPRGRSRRDFLLAPLGVTILAGVALAARMLGSGASSDPSRDAGALLPTPARPPTDVSWAPGARLGTAAGMTARAMPEGVDLPGTMLRVIAPEAGTNRTAWLEHLVASGSPPDIVTGLPACEVRRMPVASKVTDLVRRDRLATDQFDAGAYRALEAGGELWGLPYAWTGAEIGLALDRARFPRAGIPAATLATPADADRIAYGWSWPEFAEAMATAAADGRTTGLIALERFGTIRSLPATWQAQWSDADGRVALADREAMADALGHFDALRREIGSPARRPTPQPTVTVRRGTSTVTPAPTPGIMRGPASAALGTGGPALLRAGRAAASAIEVEQAPDFATSLLMPLPRGTASVADLEPLLVTVTGRADHRDAAWRFARWLVEDGRLAEVERLVPAWRPAQSRVVALLAHPVAPATSRPLGIDTLLGMVDVPPPLPRDGEVRAASATTTPRAPTAVEALILLAVRRAAPRDAVLDGPAGIEARSAIGLGLQPWEVGDMTAIEALERLAPTLQAILDRSPGVLPT